MTSAREGRWASSHIGRQRVRDGAVVLPNLSTQVVLGVRREEAAPRGAQTARELRSEDALPAPLADAQTARARRAQSADERGPSPRRRATERRGAGHGGERFLELLASPGASVLDARALARLEAEAGPGRQQEVVRLLRTLRDLVNVRDGLQKGGAAEGGAAPRAPEGQDEHQLAAQVAYLEKKVVQLRGKLKGRARDHHPPDHQDGAPGPEQDPRAASREELKAQVQALRERKAQLEAEALLGAPPPGAAGPAGGAATEDAAGAQEAETDALRRRAEKLEAQVAELAAAKEAAARSAEAARALVEAAEARLQEMIVTRETERIRLEAERDALRRRIDENQRWLEEEEALGDVEDASAVQKMVESVEASLPEQHSHSRAPAVERRCGRRARPATSMQGLRRLRDDKEAALQELRQAEEELEQARSESRARLQQLEGRVAEAARECELEAERRRQQLVAEAQRRGAEDGPTGRARDTATFGLHASRLREL
ncbi:unnamed protein product [Prorocentrum cordatum]|uniref:Centrosomal protein of 162 kDa n=1 Tax=Prorocentrum cordatum TaxID=2364126 RepID=A0ABN9T9R9_9DINO|nr:unnamed protein product [Polarella glacialis]